MAGTHDLGIFLLASLALWVTPGPDTLFILAQSVSKGTRTGIISVLGLSTGAILHTALAAFGLSVFLSKSVTAFALLKYAGAFYLAYLGTRALLSKAEMVQISSENTASIWQAYSRGVASNLLNPKVALFFIAFLPQFVDPEVNLGPLPFLYLGSLFVIGGSLWMLGVAFFASKVTRLIRNSPSYAVWLERVAGGIYLGLGVRLLRMDA